MDRKALRMIALVAASMFLLTAGAVAQPFGAIDSPTEGQTVSGVVSVSGFVLDMQAIDKIDVLVDGTPFNQAELNYPRVDVLQIFPTYAGSPTARPGFLTSFLAGNFSDGEHTVAIRVTESATQAQTIVASVDVFVDNETNQAPFGYIDIPSAAGLTGANGSFPVVGWALDDTGVTRVDFLVDGQIVAGAVGMGQPSTATYGIPRGDVQAAFPDVPNSLNSGFLANLDTTAWVNGIHIISVQAWDADGASRELGSRTVQVINNGQNLAPFGQIDFPLDKASLFCETIAPPGGGFPSPCSPDVCGPTLEPNFVVGWSLDVGARLDAGQVSYVELLLDGQIVANTRTDCVQIGQSLINCYGINRPDVAQNYSGYVNADNAGFNFTFYLIRDAANSTGTMGIYLPTSDTSVTGPILTGFTTPGKHTIAIRAGDEEETVSQFGAMSVDILCDQTFNDTPAFGDINSPTNMEQISGQFQVFGWAYDFQGVDSVDVDVDGQVVGTALYGLFRPDVPPIDSRVPTAFVGFSFILDTTLLSNTQHDIVIYVHDRVGNRTEIGRRKAVVDNLIPQQ
jgi:Bacterial Ig domain